MGYFEYDFRDFDEESRKHRFRDNFEAIATVITLILILLCMACSMTACKTTKLNTQSEDTVIHADTSYRATSTTLYADVMRRAVDSLYARQHVLDSLIERTRESLTTHTGSYKLDSVHVSDSISILIDGDGNPHYHHYHTVNRINTTHDTIYVNAQSSSTSERIRLLTDSLRTVSLHSDSIALEYARLDSAYNSLLNSSSQFKRVEKRPSLPLRFRDIILLFVIVASLLVVYRIFNR